MCDAPMFVTGKKNSKIIDQFIRSEGPKSIAVAFIGAGLSTKICGKSKILCNLTSGATNPREIAALKQVRGVVVRNHPKLHTKVYVNQDTLIVGSANLSTNGIALEDEASGWLEASIVDNDHIHVSQAQDWFNRLWPKAENITTEMLAEAQTRFDEARRNRPHSRRGLRALRDRGIYCVIYKEAYISGDADELMNTNVGPNWEKLGYGVYEQWGERLPDGVLIDYYLDGDKLKYRGTWKYDGYGLRSDNTDVQVAKRVKTPGFPVRKITQALSRNLRDIWPDYRHKNEKGLVVHINKVLNLIDTVG
jgi:hypothetical protein